MHWCFCQKCQCTRRHGYLEELHKREYLPLFWAEQERSLLQGTEAEHRPQEDEELTLEDFETHVPALVEQHADRLRADSFTLESFRVAASWVASRAFGVDSFHGVDLLEHSLCLCLVFPQNMLMCLSPSLLNVRQVALYMSTNVPI